MSAPVVELSFTELVALASTVILGAAGAVWTMAKWTYTRDQERRQEDVLDVSRLKGDMKELRDDLDGDLSAARRLVGSAERDIAVIKESLQQGNRRFEGIDKRQDLAELKDGQLSDRLHTLEMELARRGWKK